MAQPRMTKQKQLVLDVAKAHCDHPTADQLYLEVRALDSHISRGTVYRNLEQLADCGQLLHVKLPGADRFDSRLDLHCHLICTSCGAVFDAPVQYDDALDKKVAELCDFEVVRHRTIFEGLCQNCAQKLKT